MYQQQPPQQQTHIAATKSKPDEPLKEAPPKQVAMAMERLGQAARLIADIRLGADRLLEALFLCGDPHHQHAKPLHLVLKEESVMRQHLHDLRDIGKQLEVSGVLTEALRSRSNSWGLHMPLVCPDGAVVAYAWKRQLAGQAGASAVDRTRLALKSFTDQKQRFFPHLELEPAQRKDGGSQAPVSDNHEEPVNCRSFTDIQTCLEKEVPGMKIFTYGRLESLKRASSLPSSPKEDSFDMPLGRSYQGSTSLRSGILGSVPESEVAVIDLLIPSTLRAIVSLHPVGSTNPDAVAIFSPDEVGNYVHARGVSACHMFRLMTEHCNMALHYLLGNKSESALYIFLQWIGSYHALFTKVCSKCGKVTVIDRQLLIPLPPVYHSYRNFFDSNLSNAPPTGMSPVTVLAYHRGCFRQEVHP